MNILQFSVRHSMRNSKLPVNLKNVMSRVSLRSPSLSLSLFYRKKHSFLCVTNSRIYVATKLLLSLFHSNLLADKRAAYGILLISSLKRIWTYPSSLEYFFFTKFSDSRFVHPHLFLSCDDILLIFNVLLYQVR